MSADWFAARTFAAGSGEGLDLGRLRIEPLFALALSVIGALLVCEALPALVNSATLFTQSRIVGWQSRFRWILTPGNDLYVVYTRNWYEDPLQRRTYTLDRSLASKLLYTHRF